MCNLLQVKKRMDGDKAIGSSCYPLTRPECRRGSWPNTLNRPVHDLLSSVNLVLVNYMINILSLGVMKLLVDCFHKFCTVYYTKHHHYCRTRRFLATAMRTLVTGFTRHIYSLSHSTTWYHTIENILLSVEQTHVSNKTLELIPIYIDESTHLIWPSHITNCTCILREEIVNASTSW